MKNQIATITFPNPASNSPVGRILMTLLCSNENSCTPRDVGLERDLPSFFGAVCDLNSLGWETWNEKSMTGKAGQGVTLMTPTFYVEGEPRHTIGGPSAADFANRSLASREGSAWMRAMVEAVRI
jgi:hypothetical protein